MGLEQLAGFAITFLVKFLLGWLGDKRAEQAQRDLGRVTAERDQSIAGREAERELADIAARGTSDDDVLARLEKGDA